MYVCICNAVTDAMIRSAVGKGAKTLADLQRMTGCAGACGSCAELAQDVLDEARGRTFRLPVIAVPQAA
jgi:bacterioferritin-associated ferredoxin